MAQPTQQQQDLLEASWPHHDSYFDGHAWTLHKGCFRSAYDWVARHINMKTMGIERSLMRLVGQSPSLKANWMLFEADGDSPEAQAAHGNHFPVESKGLNLFTTAFADGKFELLYKICGQSLAEVQRAFRTDPEGAFGGTKGGIWCKVVAVSGPYDERQRPMFHDVRGIDGRTVSWAGTLLKKFRNQDHFLKTDLWTLELWHRQGNARDQPVRGDGVWPEPWMLPPPDHE